MCANNRDTTISKLLSWLLRHSAPTEGIHMTEDGFVDVKDILNHKKFVENRCRLADLERIVSTDQKQRYSCRVYDGEMQIRANQGHSIKFVLDPGLQLIINEDDRYLVAIHGTYYRNWQLIKNVGLSRMNRIHIHFVDFSSSSSKIINGFRSDCEILIYVNVAAALKDGIKFYKSLNNVILSPGDETGIILPKYFIRALDIKKNIELL